MHSVELFALFATAVPTLWDAATPYGILLCLLHQDPRWGATGTPSSPLEATSDYGPAIAYVEEGRNASSQWMPCLAYLDSWTHPGESFGVVPAIAVSPPVVCNEGYVCSPHFAMEGSDKFSTALW